MSLLSTPLTVRLSHVVVAVALVAVSCGSSDGDLDLSALESTSTSQTQDEATTAAPESAPTAVEEPSSTTTVDVSDDSTTTVAEPTTTTEEPVPEGEPLPEFCNRDLVVPVVAVELTFTVESGLFGVDFDGQFECLLVVEPGATIADWGAQGDKVAFADGSVVSVSGGGREGDGVEREELSLSRPTAFNLFWIIDSQARRSRIDDANEIALEQLGPVTELTHHPDGEHLLAISRGAAGDRIVVSDADGVPVGTLVDGGTDRLSELAVSVDGSQLMFVSTGADVVNRVHLLDLASVTTSTIVDEQATDLAIATQPVAATRVLYDSLRPLTDLVINTDGTRAAIAEGDCANGASVEWLDLEAEGYGTPLGGSASSYPVGFVSENTIAVIDHRTSCDGGGGLRLVDLDDGTSTMVRSQVDGAAIRTIDPPARYSLRDVAIG